VLAGSDIGSQFTIGVKALTPGGNPGQI